MLAVSVLDLLKMEDELIKKVKEAHDMNEFYSDRADECYMQLRYVGKIR